MRWLFALFAAAIVAIPSRPGPAWAQGSTGTITGTVTSADNGQPIVGATVLVVGTQWGTLTQQDGRYTIPNVPAGTYTVRASLIGYGAQTVENVTVTAGSTAVVNFRLSSEAIQMEEIVAVGYGTQRREQITSAVASVSAREFTQGPTRDVARLIAGKVAGLGVTQYSGDPRQGAEIQLRGRITIQGSTSPLVLVDGIPAGLQTVAAEDIESVSVLKDGSAAAIYGSRASNGVILITTKKHSGGAPTLRYDGMVGVSTIARRPEFLTAEDYRRLRADAEANPAKWEALGYDILNGLQDLGYGTDWQKQVLREPLSYRHNITLSGGADATSYILSATLENEEGIFKRSDNNELTVRANIRHSMYDGKLEIEGNLINRNQKEYTGPSFDYIWRQALIRNPTDRVRDDDGNWQQRSGYFYTNPLSLLEETNGEGEARQTRLHGTVTLRPFNSLRLSLTGGVARQNWITGIATTFQHPDNTEGNNGGYASRSTGADLDRLLELTGTYTGALGDHNITLLGGYSYQDFLSESFNANNSRFPTDLFDWNQLGLGDGLQEGLNGIGSGKSSYKLVGFFGRLNYDWQNRFLLMASLRYEGNSRFGAGHKWGLFPAISAGWRLTEESFIQSLPFINDLKLRAGYGVTGSAPTNSYLSLTSYRYGARFFYNGRWVPGLFPARNPNPDLRWEEKHELNVGLNFALFDSRLSGAVDVYRRETRDLLYNYSVPVPPYLTGSFLGNVGNMRNTGVELELSYDVIRRPGFVWTTSVNGSTNSNKLVSLSSDTFQPQTDCFNTGYTGEPIQTSTHRVCVGQPIGNFWGWKSVDIDDNGEWIVLDSLGQPIPIRQATERDKRFLGNGLPKYYFAWNNTAQIGNFDVTVNMRGAAGFQILNFTRMFYENPRILQYNMLKSAFDPVYGKRPVDYPLTFVSYYIEDGDYIKIDNVAVGYTLPRTGALGSLLPSAVSNARIYLAGQNLFTFTGYKGIDPEVRTSGLDPGIDHRDKYPTVRRFSAGITVSF